MISSWSEIFFNILEFPWSLHDLRFYFFFCFLNFSLFSYYFRTLLFLGVNQNFILPDQRFSNLLFYKIFWYPHDQRFYLYFQIFFPDLFAPFKFRGSHFYLLHRIFVYLQSRRSLTTSHGRGSHHRRRRRGGPEPRGRGGGVLLPRRAAAPRPGPRRRGPRRLRRPPRRQVPPLASSFLSSDLISFDASRGWVSCWSRSCLVVGRERRRRRRRGEARRGGLRHLRRHDGAPGAAVRAIHRQLQLRPERGRVHRVCLVTLIAVLLSALYYNCLVLIFSLLVKFRYFLKAGYAVIFIYRR